MMSTSGRLMSEKIDVLRLTFYTAPVSCFILIPFYVQVSVAPGHRQGRVCALGSLQALMLMALPCSPSPPHSLRRPDSQSSSQQQKTTTS
jgi:hypothetical protein